MDAGLAWTVVGSVAGVVAIPAGATIGVLQLRQSRRDTRHTPAPVTGDGLATESAADVSPSAADQSQSVVERWSGYLTDKKIRHGVHKSVQALEGDIRQWIEHWNEDPKPFAESRQPTKSSTH